LHINTTGLLPLAGLFFSASVAIFLSSNQLYGAFDLFSLFFSALLYVYAASQIRTRAELLLVVSLLMVNIAIQGTIALGQYFTNSNLGLDFFGATKVLKDYASLMALSRAGGTLGHPNSLAQFFDLTIPLAFSLLFVPMSLTRRFLLLGVVGIGLTGLTVTLSRGGMLAVGMVLLIGMTIHFCRWFGKTQGIFYVLLIIVITGSIILGTPNPIRKRFLYHDYGTALGRVPHIQVALNVIRSNPLFGVGLNNYCAEAPKYDNTPQQIMALWKSPAHNLYLFITSEIGLVGLTWILIFLIAVLRSLWPALKSPDPLLYAAGLGVLLGFLAYFIHGQFDYTHWTNFTILWFMLGLAVSLGWQATQAPPLARSGKAA
jgi:O-antigen ligase